MNTQHTHRAQSGGRNNLENADRDAKPSCSVNGKTKHPTASATARTNTAAAYRAGARVWK